MYSLVLLSCLAVLSPAFAFPSAPTTAPTPVVRSPPGAVSTPTPPALPPARAEELRRREHAIHAFPLGKRQSTCNAGYVDCGDTWCCPLGTVCVTGTGTCYNPLGDYNAVLSSMMADSTGLGPIYSSYLSEFIANPTAANAIYSSFMAELPADATSIPTSTGGNTNTNGNSVTVTNSHKKKSNTGMIAGIVVAVVVVIIAAIVAFFLFRRNKRKKDAAAAAAVAAAQQPLMSQPPAYPPTPAPMPSQTPYNPPQSPFNPPQSPYNTGYNQAPYDPYAAAVKPNPYQPAPPGTVEMPVEQSATGQPGQQYGKPAPQYGPSGQQYGQSTFPDGTHYQPPALPAAGVVEASGDSTYRPTPTSSPPPQYFSGQGNSMNRPASEMSGGTAPTVSPLTTGGNVPGQQQLSHQAGPVYEMGTDYRGT